MGADLSRCVDESKELRNGRVLHVKQTKIKVILKGFVVVVVVVVVVIVFVFVIVC
jgi:uncharacterized protein HemY